MYDLNRICCLCLTCGDKDSLKTVFCKGTEEEIFAQVKYALPELTIMDPENPVCICIPCSTTLDSFYTFKKRCLENYNRLNQYIKILQGNTDSQSETNDEAKQPLVPPEDNTDRETNPQVEFIKCEAGSTNPQDDSSSDTSEETNVLDKVETVFTNETDTQEYRCLMCNQVYTDKLHFNHHINIHIKSIKGVVCSICNKTFTLENNLKRHMRFHLGVNDFECAICKKKFLQSWNLKMHMKYHLGIKDFECTVCKKKFLQSSNLKQHMKLHEGIQNFECTICKKKFTERGHLKRHMKFHLGIKDFECSVCNKKFVLNSDMQKHLKVHLGIKDFECKICRKKFGDSGNLKKHMKTHKVS